MTADTEPKHEKRKKTLLEKYEIPIAHLDFSYIKECSNIVELERIVRILRSNEEGHYPELLSFAESRLSELAPNHRILCVSNPIITKNQLQTSEWEALEEDLTSWKNEVSFAEEKLSRWKDRPEPPPTYPQVRRSTGFSSTHQLQIEKTEGIKKSVATDYKKWDMFDADSECLKLDLEEEKVREERKRRELEESRKMEEEVQLSLEEKEIQLIARDVENLSEEERKILGLKEKELGNEFYQTNRFDNALRHYTRSIFIHPTPTAYNNRAATYLKQCRFSKALDDLNIVLELEPDNVKAHYRRAMAYQHKNEFQKALDDILEVLKHEPSHVLARHVADQLRENCASLPRKLRIKVRDPNNPSQLVVKEVTEDELKSDYQDIDYLEVNDNGLPKIMCNCNGKYTNDPIMRSNDPLKYQPVWYHREKYYEKYEKAAEEERNGKRLKQTNIRVLEDGVSGSACKKNKPMIELTGNSLVNSGLGKRLEIVELEKIEEEDASPHKKPTNIQNNIKQTTPSTCLVSDMRSSGQKSAYFPNSTEGDNKDGKINAMVVRNETSPCEIKIKKTSFNTDIQSYSKIDMDDNTQFMPSFNSNYNTWDTESLSQSRFSKMKTSPGSPPNSFANEEFSSDIDSDDDEFPDDSNLESCKLNIDQLERLIDLDIDTISKDLFPEEDLVKCKCGEGYKLRTLKFLSKWKALENSPDPLESRGKLLRLICPHQLSSVIGSNLDAELLAGFISCLSYHFDPETERDKIVQYLESLSCLQRFSIINSFLSLKDKAVVDSLFKKLCLVNNNIEEAFVS